MTIKEISEYASQTFPTHDYEYNKGRKDCIIGRIYTEEAKYFQLVENIMRKRVMNDKNCQNNKKNCQNNRQTNSRVS